MNQQIPSPVIRDRGADEGNDTRDAGLSGVKLNRKRSVNYSKQHKYEGKHYE
jgi:hypothetical protein